MQLSHFGAWRQRDCRHREPDHLDSQCFVNMPETVSVHVEIAAAQADGVTIEMSDDEKYLCACHRCLFMPELPAMPMSSLR